MNLEKNIDSPEMIDPKLHRAVKTFLETQASKYLVPTTITCADQSGIRKCSSTSNRADAEFLLFTTLYNNSGQVVDIGFGDADFKETRPVQHLQVQYDSQHATITEAQALTEEESPSAVGASAGAEN